MNKINFTKNILHALLAVAFCTSLSTGQSFWTKYYNGNFKAITPTSDGNFIAVGPNFYLVKIKPNGDTLWTKNYGGVYGGEAKGITSTADGNFIVAGYSYTLDISQHHIYLLSINHHGDTLWTKTYGGTKDDLAYAITSTGDGNFVVTGSTSSYGNGRYDFYLLKINKNGDTIWTKTYGGADIEVAKAATQTTTGNLIIAGTKSTPANLFWNVYFVMIKQNGDIVWTKTFNGTNYDDPNTIIQTTDGNFIIGGSTVYPTNNNENDDLYLLKINSTGDIIWTKKYGGPYNDFANALVPTEDGNFIAAGMNDLYMVKFNQNGDSLWTKLKHGNGFDAAYAIAATNDGNFIMAGTGIYYIIDDRYAYKSSLFSFKIPTYSDSLNFGYAPIKTPAGMTVSQGGTISWTPQTDSSYTTHVEYLVLDDIGKRDTLTFNLIVNSKEHPAPTQILASHAQSNSSNRNIRLCSTPSHVTFYLSGHAMQIGIYDIHGTLVTKINANNNTANWNGTNASANPVAVGSYFVKALDGSAKTAKQFILMR